VHEKKRCSHRPALPLSHHGSARTYSFNGHWTHASWPFSFARKPTAQSVHDDVPGAGEN
jgi:hypothetical protein